MNRITTIIMLWLAVVGCTAAGAEEIKISRDNMKLLESLDSAINNQAHYKAEKERKIAALRGNADEMTATECFAMNARLYDELSEGGVHRICVHTVQQLYQKT